MNTNKDGNANKNGNAIKQEFEASFCKADFYNKQTADDRRLNMLIRMINADENGTILDLGFRG